MHGRIMQAVGIALSAALLFALTACGNQAGTEGSTASGADDERITLTLAVGGGTILDELAIDEFNQTNTEYSVEIVNYLEKAEYDYAAAVQLLNTELLTGEGPDIIDVYSFALNLERYAEQGVLEDLNPWLEADLELSRDDFIDSVFSLCEVDGGLYGVMSAFSVKTMYAGKTIVDSLESWSLEDFYPYSGYVGSAAVNPESSVTIDGSSFLSTLCGTSLVSFVDYNTGDTDFDTEAFVDLLECCKTMQEAVTQTPKLRLTSVWGFLDIQYEESVMGEEIEYLGFPGLTEGSGGSYVNNQENFLAISASSENKEGAWELLRSFLDEAYQTEKYAEVPCSLAFPTNKNAMDRAVKYAKETLYSTDENGDTVELTWRGLYDYVYTPAKQEHIDKILALIDSATGMQSYDSVLSEIVRDEAGSYFAGDQTAEETAVLIQQRVSLYLAEQG